jgi:ribosomal protein S18 acetylase RimI-like enzyme
LSRRLAIVCSLFEGYCLLAINSSVTFRPANAEDLGKIVELVATHDEDDAEEVVGSLESCDYADHFVMLKDNTVIGISGFQQREDCDRTYFLSWTYIHEAQCGQGYGREMLQYVLDHLRQQDARKLFVKISDYADEEDGPVYAAALALYQKMGFEEECRFDDYYDTDESMTILGLRLATDHTPVHMGAEKPRLKFSGLYPIPETEYSYSFEWETQSWWKGGFTVRDLQIGLDAAYEDGAHQVVLSFPDTFVDIQRTLLNVGFEIVGNLKDYFQDGIDEVHYQFKFKNSKHYQ